MTDLSRLHPDDLSALADLVADRLAERLTDVVPGHRGTLVDAAEVAQRFGFERAWVYSHADELGAVRLGDGARPRLRFDLDKVVEALTARQASEGSPAPESPVASRSPQRRRRRRSGTRVELLPVRADRA